MIAAVLVLWVLGWLLLFRIPLCQIRPLPPPLPPVSVIIPARNEAANLPGLLASLRGQSVRPAEVLVVDDASTDATAAVARAHGATVLASAPLPDGWRGKTWACHQGARAARGELLCFCDADTRFEPDGLARVLGAWQESGGALSLAAWHDVRTWTEQLSAFFNLMMTAGIGAFTVLGRRLPPSGLFGPFLLTARGDYHAAGGHAAVKDRILENVAMAARFRRAGLATHCRGGRGAVAIRMYPGGLRELVAGWAKAFAAGAAATPAWLMAPAVAWLTGAILAFGLAAAAPLLASPPAGAALYLLYGLQFAFLLRRLGRFRLLTALLYPVPLFFYLVVFTRSLLRMRAGHTVIWKGRAIDPDRPRSRSIEHAD